MNAHCRNCTYTWGLISTDNPDTGLSPICPNCGSTNTEVEK